MFVSTLVLGILVACYSLVAQAEVTISFKGCVDTEKTVVFQDKVSLYEVLTRADVTDCAFIHGAAWLEAGRIPMQQQLKASLLKDLRALQTNLDVKSEADSEATSVQSYFTRLISLISKQQPTGRVLGGDLDLFHVEMLPLKNRVITSDAQFYFPAQPQTLNLIGFEDAVIPYDSNLSVNDIVQAHPICDDCPSGWLRIVQPDTSIEKVKVGLWTNSEYYAAPGAWLIAPLAEDAFVDISPKLYEKLTQWLALQVLSK
jgi:hypothetical protein